jgi:hypothetical protein
MLIIAADIPSPAFPFAEKNTRIPEIPASIYPMIGIGMLIIAKINAVSPKGSILFLRWLFDVMVRTFSPPTLQRPDGFFPHFLPWGVFSSPEIGFSGMVFPPQK